LVLALELAVWVVYVLLVERHRLALPFPRGRAISIRSVEILRQLGLEQEVTQTSSPRSETVHFFAGASLTPPEFGRVGSTPAQGEKAVSPTAALGCPQDRSRRCCVSGSSTIRWSTRGSEPCCWTRSSVLTTSRSGCDPAAGPTAPYAPHGWSEPTARAAGSTTLSGSAPTHLACPAPTSTSSSTPISGAETRQAGEVRYRRDLTQPGVGQRADRRCDNMLGGVRPHRHEAVPCPARSPQPARHR
jgi:hypothetical protein